MLHINLKLAMCFPFSSWFTIGLELLGRFVFPSEELIVVENLQSMGQRSSGNINKVRQINQFEIACKTLCYLNSFQVIGVSEFLGTKKRKK